MAFFDIETISALIFLVLLTLFVLFKKENMTTHKILYPFIYLSMYRTKFGLKFMESASRYRKTMTYLGYAAIIIGFIGMIFISYVLVSSLIPLLTKHDAKPSIGPVLPIKAKGVFYIPFFYWIISILIIAIVHEFAHGVLAKAHNLKVKSSGFAFFSILIPIIPLAFVEPDEKKLMRKPIIQRLSIFAAGPFTNILLGLFCVLILLLVIVPISSKFIEPNGVKIVGYAKEKNIVFPAEQLGLEGQLIKGIDGIKILNLGNLSMALSAKRPGDAVTIETGKKSYSLVLAANPSNATKPYLGALLDNSAKIKGTRDNSKINFIVAIITWFSTLIGILYVLNLGVGLFNLVPLGPLDGGRMLQAILPKFFDKEKSAKIFSSIGLLFLVIIAINLVFAFVR